MKKIAVILAVLLFTGCGIAMKMRSVPEIAHVGNEFFTAEITPMQGLFGYDSFALDIQGKTDSNIEIDWNKTLFISNGQTSGSFMFEGIVYKDRNNPKTPDIIFGKSRFVKRIWPNNLVDYNSGKYNSGWVNRRLPSGDTGVYLTVKTPAGEKNEKIILNIQYE